MTKGSPAGVQHATPKTHVDWLGKLPWTLEQPVECIELVQCSTARAKTALFLLNLWFIYQPNSPLQYPEIDFPRKAKECDPLIVGTHPLGINLWVPSPCFLYGRLVSGIERDPLSIPSTALRYPHSQGQQLPTSTVNSVGGGLLPLPEVLDGLPEFPQGWPVVLSVASPNFAQTRAFASATTRADVWLACRYPSAASGVPLANQARYDSSFSLSASLTSGVHHWVRALLPRQAPETLRPQLRNSRVNNGSGEHSPFGLNVPSLPLDLVKVLPEVVVQDLPKVPRRSQQTLTIRFGLPSLSSFLLCQRIQLTTRWCSVDS